MPATRQVRVLEEILRAAREAAAAREPSEPVVVSLHAVRAVSAVQDLVEELDLVTHHVVPVVHWFTGTSDELTRLVHAGGYVSVDPAMLTGKRGRAYVRQVPSERLLPETDLPAGPVTPECDARVLGAAHADELATALGGLRDALVGLRGRESADTLRQNQARLYGID